MSFLDKTITLTRYPLAKRARWPPYRAMEFPGRGEWVRVVLHDTSSQHCKDVIGVAAELLHLYTPQICRLFVKDPATQRWTLRIFIPTMDHVDDIEGPALKWIIQHMHGISHQHMNWNCLPLHSSIGQGVLLYRGLQLLLLDDSAKDLRRRLMQELQTKSLASYDVQRIWWTFQYTDEWAEWLEALLANLARFKVYDGSPDASYTRDFIEGEMHLLTPTERDHIEAIYRGYRDGAESRTTGYFSKAKDFIRWASALAQWPNRDVQREIAATTTVRVREDIE